MGRQKRKLRRNRIRDSLKNTCGLNLAHLPLPFGTCIDLKTYTRILLNTNDQNLDVKWHETSQQLTQIDSDMHIFDNLKSCIEYIQQEHVKKLYLLVLKSNKMNIENIQQNIIDACPQDQLTDFYILNGQHVCIGDEEVIINGTYVGDDDGEENLQMQNDKNEAFVPMAIYGLTHGYEISIRDLNNDQVRFM